MNWENEINQGACAPATAGGGTQLTPSDIAKIKRGYVYARMAVVAFVLGVSMPALYWICTTIPVIAASAVDSIAFSNSDGLPVFLLFSPLVFLLLAGGLFAASRGGMGVAKRKSGIRKEGMGRARYLEKVADAYGFSLSRNGTKYAAAAVACVVSALVLFAIVTDTAACVANAGSKTRQVENMCLAVDAFAEAGMDIDDHDFFAYVEGRLPQDSETGACAIEAWFVNCENIEYVNYYYTLDRSKSAEENIAAAQQGFETLAEVLRKSGAPTKDESVLAAPEISEETKQRVIDGDEGTTLRVSCGDGKTESHLVTSYSGEIEVDPIELSL